MIICFQTWLSVCCDYYFCFILMYCKISFKFVYCLLHLLAWIRCETVTNHPDIRNLFQSLSSDNRESVIYTEGGTSLITPKPPAETFQAELLKPHVAESVPSSETSSGSKPRKGVAISKIVPRKGVPLNFTDSELSSTSSTISPAPVYEYVSSSGSTSSFNVNSTVVPMSSLVTSSHSTTSPVSSNVLSTKPTIEEIPHKPTVTLVPADSDSFLKSLKNDRNVVIPVLALVLVPLAVLAFFLIKRFREDRSLYYTRMDFLIEDIYK